jgi:hypothetical protein
VEETNVEEHGSEETPNLALLYELGVLRTHLHQNVRTDVAPPRSWGPTSIKAKFDHEYNEIDDGKDADAHQSAPGAPEIEVALLAFKSPIHAIHLCIGARTEQRINVLT